MRDTTMGNITCDRCCHFGAAFAVYADGGVEATCLRCATVDELIAEGELEALRNQMDAETRAADAELQTVRWVG